MSDPFVSDLKLSGFKPSTGMISLANFSHDPDFPVFFNGTGMTNLAESSSLQQLFSQVSFLGTFEIVEVGVGAGIFVRIFSVGPFGCGVGGGVAMKTGELVAIGVGFGVVTTAGGGVIGGLGRFGGSKGEVDGGGTILPTEISGTFGTCGCFGGVTGSSPSMVVLGVGTTIGTLRPGGTTMSLPLQPSGKKYLMFSLRCSSSLKSPINEAFLKIFKKS